MWGKKSAGCINGKEKRDWNKYKKENKRRKLEEAAKSSKNLKSFFSRVDCHLNEKDGDKLETESGQKEFKASEGIHDEEPEERDRKCLLDNQYLMRKLDVPAPLPFFVNGCIECKVCK